MFSSSAQLLATGHRANGETEGPYKGVWKVTALIPRQLWRSQLAQAPSVGAALAPPVAGESTEPIRAAAAAAGDTIGRCAIATAGESDWRHGAAGTAANDHAAGDKYDCAAAGSPAAITREVTYGPARTRSRRPYSCSPQRATAGPYGGRGSTPGADRPWRRLPADPPRSR